MTHLNFRVTHFLQDVVAAVLQRVAHFELKIYSEKPLPPYTRAIWQGIITIYFAFHLLFSS